MDNREEALYWMALMEGRMPKDAKPHPKSIATLKSYHKHYTPADPIATVTGFSGWVFELDRGGFPKANKEKSFAAGKQVEQHLRYAKNRPPPKPYKTWKLIYQDLDDINEPAKTISRLKVNGEALKGKPDLVFKDDKNSRILIVDRKATDAKIPSDGWLNLRAQLWAYSQIDEFQDAKEILLSGEIWGLNREKMPRAVINFNLKDKKFREENEELFRMYGGTIG